jgi:hypothetical protein
MTRHISYDKIWCIEGTFPFPVQNQALPKLLSSSSLLIGKNHARLSELIGAFLLISIILLRVYRF